jgi:lipopolysaccharide transport system permease protein
MVVFTVIFGNIIGVPSEGVPYPLFSYAALLPWGFFAAGLSRSSNSLIYDANLISKVYLPRLILPLSAILSSTVDFAIAFVILLGMMLFYGRLPGLTVMALPFFLFLAFMTVFGFGLWFSAINVKYRDVALAVPFLIQFWLFITPIAYPSSIIPEEWRVFYALNPMVGVIEGFRWALLGTQPPSGLIAISTLVVVAVVTSGLFYFRRMESQFADVV